jgi:hypothetical protein
MDTATVVILIGIVLNFIATITDILVTTLLHFRYRSKCGMFSCLASPIRTPQRSPTLQDDLDV